MAYLREDYELGFNPVAIAAAGASVAGSLGKIGGVFKGLFGGRGEEKTCMDICTGQPLGKMKKKEGGCHEGFGERGISDRRYREKKVTSAGEPFNTAYSRLCSVGAGSALGSSAPGADVLGMSPMTLLIVVGAILVLRR